MGLIVKGETNYGEERDLYWRLNNFEQLANHGVPAVVRFRAFASQEASKAGRRYMAEKVIEFAPDIQQPLWPQAYAALKQDPAFKDASDTPS